jgi:predicted PurR-regulated permease PerM
MDSPPFAVSPAARVLLLGAAFVVVIAGMRAAAPILVPFLLSVLITVIAAPPLFYLYRKGLPSWLSVLVVGMVMFALGTLLVVLIGRSLDGFMANLPDYRSRLSAGTAEIQSWIGAMGVEVPQGVMQNYLDPGKAMELVGQMISSLGGLLANGFLILLTVIFMLFESVGFPAKLNAAYHDRRAPGAPLALFTRKLQRYMAIKTVTSLITGIFVTLWLGVQGLDYPLLWGLLALLLNFVPNIGSIIAAVPALLLSTVQLGLVGALWTGVGYLLINFVIGNLVEPRFLGKGLGLSTLVVFLSLVFWGWVLGPVGMLLSVPITMAVKIALDSNPSTRRLATLLGSERPPAEA